MQRIRVRRQITTWRSEVEFQSFTIVSRPSIRAHAHIEEPLRRAGLYEAALQLDASSLMRTKS